MLRCSEVVDVGESGEQAVRSMVAVLSIATLGVAQVFCALLLSHTLSVFVSHDVAQIKRNTTTLQHVIKKAGNGILTLLVETVNRIGGIRDSRRGND